MDKFLAFCRFEWLIGPFVIKLLFWFVLMVWWLWGARSLLHANYLHAFYQLIFWPVVGRVVAEMLLVYFDRHTE